MDDDPSVHPGADETCDGADQDCDDQIDEDAVDAGRWYQDRDGDGHGAGAPESACSAPSESWTELGSDCDDADVAVNPDAAESCNGVDDDCSGAIDDGADCPCTRLERAGSSYLLCSDDRPWTYASEACEDLGYHLVHIESASENDWLASELGSRRVWGGASDRDDEGTWRDTLGSALVFEAWASGEPNGGYGENCLELNRWRDGLWNDASCWSWQPYVCEAD